MEDQAEDFRIGQHLALGDDAGGDRLLDNPGLVQPLAVVADFDDHIPALVASLEQDPSRSGLARFDSVFGVFDSMVGSVADHVNQRIADGFDHIAIQLGFATLLDQVDFLAGFFGDIAHQARHFLEDALDRHHPHRHRQILEAAGDLSEMGQIACQALIARSCCTRQILRDHCLRDDQFTHGIDQRVQAIGCDFYGGFGRGQRRFIARRRR